MPLTHDFKETIRARAQAEPEFRQALLREAIESIINGDLATGKAVLRDYVNATVGFRTWRSARTSRPKSLMRMLGPKGSPSAERSEQHSDSTTAQRRRSVFRSERRTW